MTVAGSAAQVPDHILVREDNFFDTFSQQQMEAVDVVKSPATHVLLDGGARSGKTFIFTHAMISRALYEPASTHMALRFRFNATKASLIADTFPRVMKMAYPEVRFELNKSDWFFKTPEGAIIYFGGLDDKERTEKILGQGHSTIWLNEGSQISYAARNKAVTRLSQKNRLRLKSYCDCNPPPQGHWIYKLYRKGIDPVANQPIADWKKDYAFYKLNPIHNQHNLPAETLKILQGLTVKERKRFWDGEYLPAVDAALWNIDQVTGIVLPEGAVLPNMVEVVVAIDPSGVEGEEDKRSDEVGIVVVGRGEDGLGYVLEDASGRMAPAAWARMAVQLYHKWQADFIIAETNYGGAMVEAVLRTADNLVPFRAVTASRGKAVRAAPVAALYEPRAGDWQGKIRHREHFPELEEQICAFSTAGYTGERSPDRADALIWGLTHLFVPKDNSASIIDFMRDQVAATAIRNAPPTGMVLLRPPPGTSVAYGRLGRMYQPNELGLMLVEEADVAPLRTVGFIPIAAETERMSA